MKNKLIILVLLLVPGLTSRAQRAVSKTVPSRFEVTVSTGGQVLMDWLEYGPGWGCCDYYTPYSLSGLYSEQNYKTVMYGPLRAQFLYNKNSKFSFGGTLGMSFFRKKMYDRYEGRDYTRPGLTLTLMPEARSYYLTHEKFRLYGDVGIGIAANFEKDDTAGGLVAEIVPIGFTLGKKVYWNFELGAGTYYFGFMTGIGYRFNGGRK